MAVLSDSARAAVWGDVMRQPQKDTGAWAVTKHDLRAAVNAADDWIDANVGGLQSQLPEAIRTATAAHTLFSIMARFALGIAVEDATAGVGDRTQGASVFGGYKAAETWFTTNVAGAITAAITAAPNLTSANALLILEHVARARAGV